MYILSYHLFSFFILLEGLELKLKEFSHTSSLRSLTIEPIPSCYHYIHNLEKGSVPWKTRASIYRPVIEETTHSAILLTAFSYKSICKEGFWGGQTKDITAESVTKWKSLDPQLTTFTVSKYLNIKANLKVGQEFEEIVGSSKYDCHWWSDTEMIDNMIKVKIVPVIWNLDNSLIQPVVSSECLSSNSTCVLGDHSLLIPIDGSAMTCNVQLTVTLDGLLTIEDGKNLLIKFISSESEFATTIKISVDGIPNIACDDDKGEFVLVTEEGHLLSLAASQIKSTLYAFLIRNNLTNHSYPQWASAVRKTKIRAKRSATTSNSSHLPMKVVHPNPPPIQSLYWGSYPKSDVQNSSRRKRSSIWSYPEYQRIQLLDERVSWGFSELDAVINKIMDSKELMILESKYISCMQEKFFKRMALEAKAYQIYIDIILKDESVMLVDKDFKKLIILQGSYVSSLVIPKEDNQKWCNGSLLVEYKKPDDPNIYLGWLENERGRIFQNGYVSNSSCRDLNIPTKFLIPSFREGSYDVITNDTYPHMDNPTRTATFHFHFMTLERDDGIKYLSKLERSLGYYNGEPISSSFHSQFLDMYRAPDKLELGFIATLVSHIISPLLLIVVVYLAVTKILSCISFRKLSSGYRPGKLSFF